MKKSSSQVNFHSLSSSAWTITKLKVRIQIFVLFLAIYLNFIQDFAHLDEKISQQLREEKNVYFVYSWLSKITKLATRWIHIFSMRNKIDKCIYLHLSDISNILMVDKSQELNKWQCVQVKHEPCIQHKRGISLSSEKDQLSKIMKTSKSCAGT